MAKWMALKNSIAKLLWPTTRCVICGGPSEAAYPGLCGLCLERMRQGQRQERFCPGCGSFYPAVFKTCPSCFLKTPSYPKNGIFCAYPYDGDSGCLVKKLKYNNRRDLAETMAKLFHDVVSAEWDSFDLVTAVPIHVNRLRERGYNQAAVFGRALAAGFGLPFDAGLLVQTRETVSQTTLHYHERLRNPKGAFAVTKGAVLSGKRILLVDDVITTGATMKECAKVLKEAGAKRVVLLSFAAGKSRSGR